MSMIKADVGSSPCLRGTLKRGLIRNKNARFIPVLTGNTILNTPADQAEAVHPRAYGEHFIQYIMRLFPIGSSPCLRGTLIRKYSDIKKARFIPVLTGNTRTKQRITTFISVHPRAYGEHFRAIIKATGKCGSSPCLRGTRFSTHEASR